MTVVEAVVAVVRKGRSVFIQRRAMHGVVRGSVMERNVVLMVVGMCVGSVRD